MLHFVVEITRRSWGYEYKEVREIESVTDLISFSEWLAEKLEKDDNIFRGRDNTDAIDYRCLVSYFIENTELKEFYFDQHASSYRLLLFEEIFGWDANLDYDEVIEEIRDLIRYDSSSNWILKGYQLTL